jgi:hypothetical protein
VDCRVPFLRFHSYKRHAVLVKAKDDPLSIPESNEYKTTAREARFSEEEKKKINRLSEGMEAS